MKVDVRYVERRSNADGTFRYYWRRRGHLTVRLPDDKGKRWARAEELNTIADRRRDEDEPADETMSWVVAEWRDGDQYRKARGSTVGIYDRWSRDIDTRWGDLHPALLTRKVIAKFSRSLRDRPSTQRHAMAVLTGVLDVAYEEGLVDRNHAKAMRRAGTKPRSEHWTTDNINAWLDAADSHPQGRAMRVAFLLCLYTAQRPADVLRMTWAAFDGAAIKLRQQKTGKELAVPCHARLRQELAAAERSSVRIVHLGGAASTPYKTFNRAFNQILAKADLTHLQARDLRRTAVVNLAEARATVPEIASITGHSIGRTSQILSTYHVATTAQQRSAVARWERHKPATDNASESNVAP